MKEFNFKTYFGNVQGFLAEDVCEFSSDECIIIARDSDHDGPYWEEAQHDWAGINDICHRIFDDNLYGVAKECGDDCIIDSTSSFEEMRTWSAWVTDNAALLYQEVEKKVKSEIKDLVNKAMFESLNAPDLDINDINEWTEKVYSFMKSKDAYFVDAFEAVAEEHGYEV